MEELFKVMEVCKILKIDRSTFYEMKEQGKIQVSKPFGELRVTKSEIDRLLKPIN